MPVFTISVADGISFTATPTITHNITDYYKAGINVTLSGGLEGEANPNCQKAYFINGQALTDNNIVVSTEFVMPTNDVTVTIGEIHADWATQQQGTQEDPYLIYFPDQLDLLATNVNAGNNYSGKFFKLMNDISVTTMVGDVVNNSNRSFNGTFDGGGHTLTFHKGPATSRYNSERCAPFGVLSNATIKNLHTTGAIYTSKKDAAGMAVRVIHTTHFISCRSSMVIDCSYNGPSSCGGFIASCPQNGDQLGDHLCIYFDNCLFDGALIGSASTTGWGGFIGYYHYRSQPPLGTSGMVYFNRCLFAPTTINVSNEDAKNFVRIEAWAWSEMYAEWIDVSDSFDNHVVSINRLYYTQLCGNTSYQSQHATQVGNMTNIQLRNAFGNAWIIVTEDNVEKVVPAMGNVITRQIAGYGNSTNPNGGYVLLASPIGTVNPEHVNNMLANNYDLYAFDQAAELEWRNYEANSFDLEPGKGYLYANSADVTLVFPGTPYTGSGEVTLSRTDDMSVDFQGWNLVGNPYNQTAYIEDGREFYTMNEDGSEIIVSDREDHSIAAMEGVFVIAEEDNEIMTFTTAPQASQKGDVVIDRAIVRFGEGSQQRNLPKFQLRDNSTKVYIPQDHVDYAVVNVGRNGVNNVSTEIPVNFKAKENGTYTLTASESLNSKFLILNYLHLIDNLTGADVDLLQAPSYTFESSTTDYASRFKLVFATGNAEDDDDFAYISNGEIIVNGTGTLEVFDVLGRQRFSRQVTSDFRLLSSVFSPGIYVLQLTRGTDVKTQKIVIE